MNKKAELYFKSDTEWRQWLHDNHNTSSGVHLIFFKVENEEESMRWEEAVKVALCYGWIDSTVKSLGNGKRKQYFCPRKPKSAWSKVNKTHIEELMARELMHESGLARIKAAKENGSWAALDDVENCVIPEDLKLAFASAHGALENFKNFTRGQKKTYLYWLNHAKRNETRQKRITEIIQYCADNIKYRNG